MIVVDANIAIAALNPVDAFHQAALRRCLQAERVAILNITRAEALIHPTRTGRGTQAAAALERLGFKTEILDNATADRACALRAEYGGRNFPMVDVVVVALGVERGWTVVTADSRWPRIAGADVEVLTA